jgi:hypothetical protein
VAFRPAFFDDVEHSLGHPGGFTAALDRAARAGRLAVRSSEDAAYWDVGTYAGYVAALADISGIDPAAGLAEHPRFPAGNHPPPLSAAAIP